MQTLAFVADLTPQAQELLQRLLAQPIDLPVVPEPEADVIIALGGDGFMLKTLRRYLGSAREIYGVHCGTVGFLLNEWRSAPKISWQERLDRAERVILSPLRVTITTQDQVQHAGFAINEVSLLRERHQAAKIQIAIDGTVRLEELVGDGVLLATPAGSTAYNLSARGPVLPLRSPLLALTPISPFRPRRWHGALLPNTVQVDFVVCDAEKRPVSAVMDDQEIREVATVRAVEDPTHAVTVLFDPDQRLDERILREQFTI